MSTNLIDTYVSEVGRHLPRKTRADIEAEIRSILQDMLDERSQKTGKPVDDDLTLDVLKAYGAPEKVAATYLGERYLIGPRLYPIFMLVLRIVLLVTGILAAIGLGIALSHTIGNPQNAFETIIKAIANFAASIMTALGNIVLIFAILEWALFRAGAKVDVRSLPKEKEWDPSSLTKVSTPNQVKMGETIVEIVGCFAAIVIFNFYPQIIGFTPSLNSVFENGNWSSATFVPLLSEAFFYYVPFLTLVWAATIILNIVLLRMGHWTTITRLFTIGLKVINLIIAAAMLSGPSLIAIDSATLISALGDANAAGILMPMITLAVHIVLWLAIIGGSIDIIRVIYRTVTDSK
ncbi:MAG: hypothetical protein NTV38_08625 [Chloroflexi bacterium]|nr:hypothetical protein [Chloroflexota bacterium]